MTNVPQIGDKVLTWFSDQSDGKSVVIDVTPYTGRYKDDFTHVLKLSAPRTRRGWMEMPINGN